MSPRRSGFRVLMLNYEFPPIGGGTGIACRELLAAFGRVDDVSVDLVTAGPGPQAERGRPWPGTVVHRVPVGKRDLHYWRPSELVQWTARAGRLARRLLDRNPYDLCHCWAGWPPGLLGYRLRRRLPYLVSLRGSDVPGYSPRLKALDPLLLRRVSRRVWREAAAVVAVSDELRELALRTAPELAVDVIPNAVDNRRFRPGTPPDRFTVLFVGRLIPRKGARDLVGAFGRIVREVSGARLVVVGGGPEEAGLRAAFRAAGLEGSVTLLGQVPNDELPPIYRDAHVCVLPSRREGMSNVLLEAMASGLPVVTTGTARAVIDGNGHVVEPGDEAAIARAVIGYARDEAHRLAHSARSRRIAESTSWSRVALWYRDIYRSISPGRSSPAAPSPR